ncbi:hypothetical protein [Celeribacter arenosi]|uniref:Lipoprotein n=1 Tax=Celeribacter arenosi TaxID=792649 RepID=A0ABP7KEL7_9RHOB
MRQQIVVSGLILTLLSGCGGDFRNSKVNPLNWFGQREQTQTLDAEGRVVRVLPTLAPRKGYPAFVDTRAFAPSITALDFLRTATGSVLSVTTVVPTLGYADAALVPVEHDDGSILILEFRLRAPKDVPGIGSVSQREITVARAISNQELAQLTQIQIRSASGVRTLRP